MDEFFARITPMLDAEGLAPYTLQDAEFARATDWRDCAPWYRDFAAAALSSIVMVQFDRANARAIATAAMREFLGALIG